MACSKDAREPVDGYMEDLATDRIYRLTIAQRLRHPGAYTPASLAALFEEELARILSSFLRHSRSNPYSLSPARKSPST